MLLVGERIVTTSSLSSHITVTTWGVLLCMWKPMLTCWECEGEVINPGYMEESGPDANVRDGYSALTPELWFGLHLYPGVDPGIFKGGQTLLKEKRWCLGTHKVRCPVYSKIMGAHAGGTFLLNPLLYLPIKRISYQIEKYHAYLFNLLLDKMIPLQLSSPPLWWSWDHFEVCCNET